MYCVYPSAYGLPKFVVAHEALPLGRVDVVVLLVTGVVDDEVSFVWVHDDVEEELTIDDDVLVDPPVHEGW